jgi:hypothetical protein
MDKSEINPSPHPSKTALKPQRENTIDVYKLRDELRRWAEHDSETRYSKNGHTLHRQWEKGARKGGGLRKDRQKPDGSTKPHKWYTKAEKGEATGAPERRKATRKYHQNQIQSALQSNGTDNDFLNSPYPGTKKEVVSDRFSPEALQSKHYSVPLNKQQRRLGFNPASAKEKPIPRKEKYFGYDRRK